MPTRHQLSLVQAVFSAAAAKVRRVDASVVVSGSPLAEAEPLVRSCPNKEMSEPGASGAFAAKLAALTAALKTGGVDEAPSPPVTSRVPTRLREGSLAVAVRVSPTEQLVGAR